MWCSPLGQPLQRLCGSGDPLPPAPGKHALVYSTKSFTPSIFCTQHESAPPVPHPTAPMASGPPAPSKWQHPSPAGLYPHLNWKPSQRVAPEEPPPLEEKGWNTSSQNINRGSAGSLHQGFRSSTEGERGTLQDKLPPFSIVQDLTHDLTTCFLGHDCIHRFY